MPWCDDCAKFWNPNSMPPDGTCPTCGHVIAEVPDTAVPWHFWLLLGALVLYLGWRVVQGVQWLADGGSPFWAITSIAVTAAAIGGFVWWWLRRRRATGDAPGPTE